VNSLMTVRALPPTLTVTFLRSTIDAVLLGRPLVHRPQVSIDAHFAQQAFVGSFGGGHGFFAIRRWFGWSHPIEVALHYLLFIHRRDRHGLLLGCEGL